jgi:hypothetical protein
LPFKRNLQRYIAGGAGAGAGLDERELAAVRLCKLNQVDP